MEADVEADVEADENADEVFVILAGRDTIEITAASFWRSAPGRACSTGAQSRSGPSTEPLRKAHRITS
ncbi:MAG: hypothetical protein JWL58_5967 [Streptosporangiaceae bacterium]|nr:hypothetical protein [Streptosporangiaceae bacterium]